MATSTSRTFSGSGSHSSTPICELSSSTSPIAAIRASSLLHAAAVAEAGRAVVAGARCYFAQAIAHRCLPGCRGTRGACAVHYRCLARTGDQGSIGVKCTGNVLYARRAASAAAAEPDQSANQQATGPPARRARCPETTVNHPVPPLAVRRPFPAALLDALKSAFGERVSTSAQAVRAHHGRDESPFDPQLPDAVVFARSTEEVQTDRQALRRARRADHSLRQRFVAGRPSARGARRCIDRSLRNEPGAVDQRRRPDRHRPAGHLAQAVERSAARHRPLLPDRPGRGREHRRHDGDARLGHQRRALRHDARERARRSPSCSPTAASSRPARGRASRRRATT